VPLLEYVGERSEMGEWTAKQIGKGVMDKYIRDNASRGETKFPLQSPR
jgi:hypothetical protein